MIRRAAPLGTILLLATPALSLAGIQHIVAPPPPQECEGCTEPGLYLHASVLYLHSYNSEEDDYRGEWDAGVRGTLGWATPSGLTLELTGFRHETDFESDSGTNQGDHEFYYIDFTIGDSIQCGELCLTYAGGIRFGGNEFNEDRAGARDGSEFDGIGPVIAIGATRSLTERLSLYASLRQSLLFGEDEYTDVAGDTYPTDTLTAITEIGAGLQLDFALGGIDAFVRGGVEGQYWFEDGANIGLFGGVFTLGGHF